MGYKVFSIDKDERHIDFQKESFCKMPNKYTFLHKYLLLNKPELIQDENKFKAYCETIKNNNIKFIVGNFANHKIQKQIDDYQWDIVISLGSMHFMSEEEKEITSNAVNKHLKKNGVFMITAKSKALETITWLQNPNLFQVKNLFIKYFSHYKILASFESVNSESMTIYKP